MSAIFSRWNTDIDLLSHPGEGIVSELSLPSALVALTLPAKDPSCTFSCLCLTLCDPMDCSTPGFPVLHSLPEFAQTHVHWINNTIQPSHPLSPSSSSCPQSFVDTGSFSLSQLFTSGGPIVGLGQMPGVSVPWIRAGTRERTTQGCWGRSGRHIIAFTSQDWETLPYFIF